METLESFLKRISLIRLVFSTIFGIVAYFLVMFIAGAFFQSTLSNSQMFWEGMSWKLSVTIFLFYLYLSAKAAPRDFGEAEHHTTKSKEYKDSEDTFIFNSREGKIKISNPFRGILILGGAGAGKTKSLIEPIIYQAIQKGYTGIMYDFKTPDAEERQRLINQNIYSPTLAEIAAHAGTVSASKVKQYYINFLDLNRSHRCNPLDTKYLKNTTFARQYAETVLKNTTARNDKDNYFLDVAIGYFTGVIWYLRSNAPQFCTLPHAVAMVIFCDLKEVIETIKEDIEVESIISSIVDAQGSDRTIANITSTLKNGLSKINTKEIAWVLSGNDLNLNLNDPGEPKFLTVGNNPAVQNALSPVISLIISSALSNMNTQGKAKSVVILDEAPTLYLPNFDNTPATARANKVASVYAAQDISQMVDMYGEQSAQKIIANLGSQFFGQTNNLSTVKNTIELFGKVDTVKYSYSDSSSSKGGVFDETTHTKGSSESRETRERIKANDITSLVKGEFLANLVESNFRSIKTQIKAESMGNARPLPEFNQVDDTELMSNFRQIREDVRSLVSPKPSASRDHGHDRSSNDKGENGTFKRL